MTALVPFAGKADYKYVNEYNEKREELLQMHTDMDKSEIIKVFIEKPIYDSSNRVPSKATPELPETPIR